MTTHRPKQGHGTGNQEQDRKHEHPSWDQVRCQHAAWGAWWHPEWAAEEEGAEAEAPASQQAG